MNFFETRKYPQSIQHLFNIGLIVISALSCYYLSEILGCTVVVLVLLMTVSIIAMLFDLLPVLFAAILSALFQNFFFILPMHFYPKF